MDNNEIMLTIFLGLFGFLICIWIFHSIIQSAIRSKRIMEVGKIQAELLAQIAIKSGVDQKIVAGIIARHSPEKSHDRQLEKPYVVIKKEQ